MRDEPNSNSSAERSVLFVCTANRCRSPMAEALFRDLVQKQDGQTRWRVSSAGTWAVDGLPAMPLAEAVMEELGLDIKSHSAHIVDHELLSSFSLILVMERGHKEALQVEFSEIAKRIYLLTEMCGGHYDIYDPVSGTLRDYRATAAEIRQLIEQGWERIDALACMDSD